MWGRTKGNISVTLDGETADTIEQNSGEPHDYAHALEAMSPDERKEFIQSFNEASVKDLQSFGFEIDESAIASAITDGFASLTEKLEAATAAQHGATWDACLMSLDALLGKKYQAEAGKIYANELKRELERKMTDLDRVHGHQIETVTAKLDEILGLFERTDGKPAKDIPPEQAQIEMGAAHQGRPPCWAEGGSGSIHARPEADVAGRIEANHRRKVMSQPILTEYQLIEQIQKQVQTIAAQQEDAAEQAAKMYSTLTRQITKLSKSVDNGQADIISLLNQVLTMVSPPLPVQAIITLSLNTKTGENMDPKHPRATSGVDLTITDDGTGGTATLSFTDSVGNIASLPAGATISAQTWTASNPAITITPDPSGLFAKFAPTPNPSGPPALATGITISVSNMTLTLAAGTTSTITGNTAAQAVDVIADTPTSSVMALSTP